MVLFSEDKDFLFSGGYLNSSFIYLFIPIVWHGIYCILEYNMSTIVLNFVEGEKDQSFFSFANALVLSAWVSSLPFITFTGDISHSHEIVVFVWMLKIKTCNFPLNSENPLQVF